MTVLEAKRRLAIERQILKLLGELGDDMIIANRVTFQIAHIGDLERFIMNAELNSEQSPRSQC